MSKKINLSTVEKNYKKNKEESSLDNAYNNYLKYKEEKNYSFSTGDEHYRDATQMALDLARQNKKVVSDASTDTKREPLIKNYTNSPSSNFGANVALNWIPKMQSKVSQGRKAVTQEDSYAHATEVMSSLDEKSRKLIEAYVNESDESTARSIATTMGMGGGQFGLVNTTKNGSNKQNIKKEFIESTGASAEEFEKYVENATWLKHYNANESEKEKLRNASAAELAIDSVGDIVTSPISSLMALGGNKPSTDEELSRDYYNLYATSFNSSQNVESAVNDAITEANGGKETVWNNVYNIGMSMGKSAMSMAVGGAAGYGTGLGEIGSKIVANLASLPSFGSAAYLSTYKEAAERGATDKQASVTGMIAGLAEMGTEVFSLDMAWDIVKNGGTKLGKSVLANMIAQSVTEGLEEGASDVINEVADIIVNQNLSEYNLKRTYYSQNGMSEEDAKKQATKDFFEQLKSDIFAGAISGLVFGVGATGVNTAVTTHYGRNIGLGKYGDILEESNPSYVSQNRQDYSSDEAYTTAQKASLDFKKAQYSAAEGKRISGKAARELYKGVSESVMDQASVRESNLVTKISEATDVKELTKAYESAPTDEEGNVSKAVQEAFDIRAERFDANDLESVVTPKKAAELAYKGKEFTDSQKAYIENNQDEKEAIESAYKNGTNRRIIENNDNAFIDSSTGDAHVLDMDKGITKKGDSYVVADNEGNTYNVADIQATKRLKDAITYSSGFIDEAVANASLEVFKNNPESTPTVVKTAISWARQAAAFGNVSFSQFSESKKGKAIKSMMDINTLKDIYELEYKKALESQKKKKSDKVFKNKEAGLYYDKSIAKAVEEKYSQAERTLVDMMARATGQRYVITNEKSAVGDRANFTANIATAVFRLDENPSLWQTVNHEGLGEVLEAFNNEDMKEIQDVIISYLIDSYGGEDKLFTHLFTTYGGNYKGKTVRELADEMVNDTIAGITSKGEEFDKLIKWLEPNKTVEEQKSFCEKFKEMLSKIWTYIKGVVSKNELDEEAMKAYKMSEKEASRVMDMILNALDKVNESENIQVVEMAGYEYDQETSTVYSLKYSTSQENMSEVDRDSLIKSISQLTGRTEEEAERYLADEAVAEIVKGTFLDFDGNEKEIAIKNNSDYPQGTIDLTNICPKRVPVTKLTNRLQEALPNDLFTADDYADIRLILMDDGRIVACGLCYVEDRRQYLGEIAQDFINEWNKALTNKTNLKRINSSKEIKDVSIGEDVAKRYGVSSGLVTPYKMKFKQETFAVSDNWFKLQKEHPDIAAAFEAFNNARGQSAGRLLLDRAEYKREILKWSPDKVKEVNDVGGLRIFSFSDFEVVHLIDLLQIIEDCAVMGVKIQGYTKQTKFAKLVSKTGIKLNRSFIPYGATGLKKVNGKTVLAIDTIEGINNEDEYFLDESDNPNVGNNITGINDEQIHVAMKDNFFHYIIPFHTNKKAETNAKLGVAMWRNYKLYQTDKTSKSAEDIQKVFKEVYKNKANGMSDTDAYDKALKDLNIKFSALKEDKMVNIYTEVLPDDSVVDEKTFLFKYLDVCKERNIVPRYPQFLNVDEEGNFLYTEGYTKFLVDFKLFNYETGEILPQENVVPVFNDEYIASIVNEELSKTEEERYKDEYPEDLYKDILNYIKVKHGYKGNTKSYEKYKKIVSDQVARSNRDEDGTRGMSVSPSTQYSIKKDSQGKELTPDQVEYFKDSKAVDEDGNLLVLYHGTPSEGFNEFKSNEYVREINGDNLIKGYFSEDEDYASIYGQTKPYYLNIKNPLILDGEQKTLDGWKKFFKKNGINGVIFDSSVTGENGTKDTLKGATYDDGETYYTFFEIFDSANYWWDDGNITEKIAEAGYDGIKTNDETEKAWMPFNSNAIKNVDNEHPTKDDDIRYSIKDSRYLELAKDPEGNAQELQKMVEDAAKEAGYGKKAYHGTKKMGYVSFNPILSKDQISMFFTNNINTASSYSGDDTIYGNKRDINKLGYTQLNSIIQNLIEPFKVKNLQSEKDGKYSIVGFSMEKGHYTVETFDSLDDVRKWILENHPDSLKEYSSGVYSVFLRTENPLEIDAGINVNTNIPKVTFGYNSTNDYLGITYWTDIGNYSERINKSDTEDYARKYFPKDYQKVMEAMRKTISGEYNVTELSDILVNKILSSNWNDISFRGSRTNTRSIAKYAYDNGYDSVIIKNLTDNGGYGFQDFTSSDITIMFNPNNVKLANAVTYDDNGEVIPLSERFASGTNDIRYSIKQLGDSSPYAKAYKQMDVVTKFMDQVNSNVVGKKKLKKDQIEKLGNMLIGRYNMTMDVAYIKELRSDIETFDKYMISGDTDFNTMMDYLMQIADEVRVKAHYFSGGSDMDNDLVIASQLLSEYYKMRNVRNSELTKKTEAYKEELKKDFNEVVDEIESKLKAEVINAKSVEAYGSKPKINTNVDIRRMAEEMAYDRLNDIQYAQENSKRRQRIVNTCTRLINWMEKPTNEKHVPVFLKPALTDMINSIDFMPKSMQVLEYLQPDTKVARNWKDSMEKLKRVTEEIQNSSFASKDVNERLMYQMSIVMETDDIIEKMNLLLEDTQGQMLVSRLSNENLKRLSDIMDSMSAAINNLNSTYKNARFESVDKLGEESVKEMRSLRQMSDDSSKAKEFFHDFFNLDMLEPNTFFSELGSASSTIMDEFFKGELEGISVVKEAENTFNDIHERLGLTSKDTQKWSEEIHVVRMQNQEVKMTTADIMYLYAADKRERLEQERNPDRASYHIAAGGIKVASKKIGSKIINANPKIRHADALEVEKIISVLSDTQKAYVDEVVNYLSTVLGEHGNKVSMEMYGYRKFEGNYYIPLKTDKDSLAKTESTAVTSQQMMRGLINQGFTKTLVDRADNALEVHDFFDVVTEHINGMSNYVAYAMPIADALRWYNYASTTRTKVEGSDIKERITDSLTEAMKSAMGQKSTAYFETFLRDVNMNNRAEPNGMADYLIGRYKAQAVGANLRVVVQQPCAIFRAEDVIESKYLVNGVAKVMTNPKKYMEYAQDTNLLCYWKSKGFADTRIAQNMKQVITGNVSKIDSLVEFSGVLAGWADDITWASMYMACEDKVSKTTTLTGNEYRNAVDEMFSDIVNNTQVIDSMLRQTQQMRKKDRLAKLANAFKKEPQKTYNMLHKKLYDYYQNKNSVNAKKALSFTLKVYVKTAIVTAIAQSVADACRDDSEDKWVEKFLKALLPVESVEAIKDAIENGLEWSTAKNIYAGSGNIVDNLNPLTLIPYLSDLDSFLKGFDSVRMDTALLQQISEISTVLDKKTATTYQKLYKISQLVSSATGIGISNLLREFKVLNNNLIAPFTGLKIYSSTSKRDQAEKDKAQSKMDAIYDSGNLQEIKASMNATYQSKIDAGKDESDAWAAVRTELKEQFTRQYKENPSTALINQYSTLYANTKHKSTKKSDNGRYVNYSSEDARKKILEWIEAIKNEENK